MSEYKLRSRKAGAAGAAAAPPGGKVDMADIRGAAKDGRIAMVIDGVAYDFTDFADEHPGGPDYLKNNAGKDATEEFLASHPTDIIKRTLSKQQFATMPLGPVDASTVRKEDVAVAAEGGAGGHGAAPRTEGEMPTVDQCINIYDFEAIASRTVKEQGWMYYSSGADDEVTLRENHNAFHRIWFRPRVLVDVREVDSSTTILGHRVSVPIFLSAIAMCKLGHPEGEVAWQTAAGDGEIIYMIPTLSSCAFDDIVAARRPKQPMFFQLYVNQDREKTQEIVERAERAGCSALFITVDAPQLGNREKDRRVKISHAGASVQKGATGGKSQGTSKALTTFIDPSLDWADVRWFQSITSMKIVLKGVACAEDAVRALHAGVAGVLLSNHGGRQLDFARSAIEILPEVMAALRQEAAYDPATFEVFIDGGVRRGTDVFKALALGAKAVGVGRPALYAMSAFGTEGVARMIAIFKEEFEMTMRLMGTPALKDIREDMVITTELSQHVAPVPVDHLQRETYIAKTTQAAMNKLERRLTAAIEGVVAAKASPPGPAGPESALGVALASFGAAVARSIFTLDARTSVHRTGLFLTLFLLTHVAGNLSVFAGRDAYNTVVHALATNPVVRGLEFYLLAAAVLHLSVGAYLTIKYKKLSLPRGKPPLALLERAKLAITGALIAGFVAVHLLHFRFGAVPPYGTSGMRDFYAQQARVMKEVPVLALYLVAVLMVGVHLWFGWEKTCSKFGLTGGRKHLFQPVARLGQLAVVPVVLGFAAIAVKSHLM